MTDPRTPSNDPGRPPSIPASVRHVPVQVIQLTPELLATVERIATAFETIAAALLPDLALAAESEEYCQAAIWRPGAKGEPLVCTRPKGHPPGHVARDEDGNVLACELGRPPAHAAEGFVCPACGEPAGAKP